jgi:hypothetical protein
LAQRRLPSIELKHPHCQTARAAELTRLLQSFQALDRSILRPLDGPPDCQWLA